LRKLTKYIPVELTLGISAEFLQQVS